MEMSNIKSQQAFFRLFNYKINIIHTMMLLYLHIKNKSIFNEVIYL